MNEIFIKTSNRGRLFRRTTKWLVISNEPDIRSWKINTPFGQRMLPQDRGGERGPSVRCAISDGKTLSINVAFCGRRLDILEPISIELRQSFDIENSELRILDYSLEALTLMWGMWDTCFCTKGSFSSVPLSEKVNIFMGLSSSSDLVKLAYVVVPIYIKAYCCKEFKGNLFITEGRIYTYE